MSTSTTGRRLALTSVAGVILFGCSVSAEDAVHLRSAAAIGDGKIVADSLAKGVPIDGQSKEGLTALMLAAGAGREDVLTTLLAKGANPNAKTTKDALTPLMFAAHGCHRAAIDALLAAKADATLKDSGGMSGADYLLSGCNDPKEAASLMELLHSKGASIKPRGDALGLLLAEGTMPDVDALIKRTLAEK